MNKGILAERLSCRCRGGHEHERIQGNNGLGDRSAQAAGYPKALAIEVVVGACEELLERDLEKQAFPAEVENLTESGAQRGQFGQDGLAGCESAEYREERGKHWLVLKHATWRDTKFDPRSLEETVQAELTG